MCIRYPKKKKKTQKQNQNKTKQNESKRNETKKKTKQNKTKQKNISHIFLVCLVHACVHQYSWEAPWDSVLLKKQKTNTQNKQTNKQYFFKNGLNAQIIKIQKLSKALIQAKTISGYTELFILHLMKGLSLLICTCNKNMILLGLCVGGGA